MTRRALLPLVAALALGCEASPASPPNDAGALDVVRDAPAADVPADVAADLGAWPPEDAAC